jgi:hypothetical protein
MRRSRRAAPIAWPGLVSDASLAAGEGALDCDGHVSVSECLVTDDRHEGCEHEYHEADRHRRTNSGKDHGKHEQRCGPGEQGEVEWVDGGTRNVYSAKSVSTYTATGTATVNTVAVAPMCASSPM